MNESYTTFSELTGTKLSDHFAWLSQLNVSVDEMGIIHENAMQVLDNALRPVFFARRLYFVDTDQIARTNVGTDPHIPLPRNAAERRALGLEILASIAEAMTAEAGHYGADYQIKTGGRA